MSRCGACNCQDLELSGDQPFGVEIHVVDDVFVKQMHVPKAGTYIPQHSHVYDHLSMLAVGKVRVWADGVEMGEFSAPHGITIKAGVKHTFLTMADDTIIYCIHNAARADVAAVFEEHQLVKVA